MNRLRSLDGLRGVAAFAIVIGHWFFFFPDNAVRHGWTIERLPYFWLLRPVYLQGWSAVDIFFTLSGFVFFWLYGDAIRARTVNGLTFAFLRFSRLYPLQLATLLLVAALQASYLRSQGHYFLFDQNDWPHFVAQLFMVQNWWPRSASSFDGVNWSVSIEVLLYVVFFLACRAGLKRGLHCLMIALLGGLLLPPEEHIARGVIGFFMGGFAFVLWQTWKDSAHATFLARASGWATLAGWVLIGMLTYIRPEWFFKGEGNNVFVVPFDFLLCPLTVFALALREHLRGPSHTALGFLGDISYSVYLLHFPMMVSLALLAIAFHLDTAFLMQGPVMLAFLLALLGLSTLTYYRFERPLQLMLRDGWRRRAVMAAPSHAG